jgi:hypothetical protein
MLYWTKYIYNVEFSFVKLRIHFFWRTLYIYIYIYIYTLPNLISQVSNYNCISPFLSYIQLHDCHLASRSMFLLLILIYRIILCSDGKYLHFSCDNVKVTGMNTLRLISFVCCEQQCVHIRGTDTATIWQNSRIIGTRNCSVAPCHKYLTSCSSKSLPKWLKSRQISRVSTTNVEYNSQPTPESSVQQNMSILLPYNFE